MIITLVNPSPSRGRKLKINSKKGERMALTASQKKILKDLAPSMKRTSSYMKRKLTLADRYPFGIVPKKGKKSMVKAKSAKRAKVKTYAKKGSFRVKRTGKIRTGAHRPLVIFTGKSWKRPLKSKAFPRPTRINPKRSHRRYRRNPLALPKLPFGINKTLMTALPVAGGLALGMFAMPQIVKVVPESLKKYAKFYGVAHVVLGVAAMTFVKKDIVKTLGGTLVAMGLYDLLACNVKALKLPPLPGREESSLAADEIVGASFETIGRDFEPAGALGASYGASYGADDIDYGGDSIEIG